MVDERRKEKTYVKGEESQNVFAVLMTGTMKLNGKKYTVLFCRVQASKNPRGSVVGLLSTFFVRSDDKYQVSEAPALSKFAYIPHLMGFGDTGWNTVSYIGTYEDFRKHISQAAVPPSFYDFE